jgi:hypothetical protein
MWMTKCEEGTKRTGRVDCTYRNIKELRGAVTAFMEIYKPALAGRRTRPHIKNILALDRFTGILILYIDQMIFI